MHPARARRPCHREAAPPTITNSHLASNTRLRSVLSLKLGPELSLLCIQRPRLRQQLLRRGAIDLLPDPLLLFIRKGDEDVGGHLFMGFLLWAVLAHRRPAYSGVEQLNSTHVQLIGTVLSECNLVGLSIP